MALLIHGCEASQTTNSLKNYAADVSGLITKSDNNGALVFQELRSGEAKSDVESLQTQLNTGVQNAIKDLASAQRLSAPGAMASAQTNLVLVMKMRRDGLEQIAANIAKAAVPADSVDAVYAISEGTSTLYASDVVYKKYVGTAMAGALNGDGLTVGGNSGVQINSGQIVPDLGWLSQNDIAIWLGVTVPSKVANGTCTSLCGHSLNSVTVGSTTLNPDANNTVPANPAPTFQLNITNGGEQDEFDVQCKVTIKGLPSDTATSTIAETTPGETTNCEVTLPSPPTPGLYQVTAEVMPVTGEKNIKNNIAKYNVTFN